MMESNRNRKVDLGSRNQGCFPGSQGTRLAALAFHADSRHLEELRLARHQGSAMVV